MRIGPGTKKRKNGGSIANVESKVSLEVPLDCHSGAELL